MSAERTFLCAGLFYFRICTASFVNLTKGLWININFHLNSESPYKAINLVKESFPSLMFNKRFYAGEVVIQDMFSDSGKICGFILSSSTGEPRSM